MDMCELRSQQGRQRLAGHWVSAEHVGLEELNVTGQCVPGGSTLVQFPGGWSCRLCVESIVFMPLDVFFC